MSTLVAEAAGLKGSKSNLLGNINRHFLVGGSSKDTKQLVEDGGQKVDHDVTLHCMKALKSEDKY